MSCNHPPHFSPTRLNQIRMQREEKGLCQQKQKKSVMA